MKLKYICLIPLIGLLVYMAGCFNINKFASRLVEEDALYNEKWLGAFILGQILSFGMLLVFLHWGGVI